MSWQDPRRILERYNVSAKKSFSQNFLVAKPIAEKIAEATRKSPATAVIELGAGLGTLTSLLLQSDKFVIAVERDRDMAAVLRAEFGANPRLSIREADAAALDYQAFANELGHKPCVVGNLPYAITGAILRQLMHQAAHVADVVVMVQREVRDRLVAGPGTTSYGALSVFVQAAFVTTPLFVVSKGSFFPAPKVESAVVRLTPHAEPRAKESAEFQAVVRASFQARRKTLRNALSSLPNFNPVLAQELLAEAHIDGQRRGETLSVQEFAQLAEALRVAGRLS